MMIKHAPRKCLGELVPAIPRIECLACVNLQLLATKHGGCECKKMLVLWGKEYVETNLGIPSRCCLIPRLKCAGFCWPCLRGFWKVEDSEWARELMPNSAMQTLNLLHLLGAIAA